MLGKLFRVDDMFKGRRNGPKNKRGANAAIQTFPVVQEQAITDVTQGSAPTLSEMEENLEAARRMIKDLRQRTRAQAQQIMFWRRAHRMQDIFIARLQREKNEQLRNLSSKVLLVQSRLIRKQKAISSMLTIRENIIQHQKIIIESLTTRLTDNGLEVPQDTEIDTTLPDLESLNDSDSAVIMEDLDSDSASFNPQRITKSILSDRVTVVRSISDAIDPCLRHTAMRRSSGYLRRPEVLETVYSVEEDGDDSQTEDKGEANKKRDAFARSKSSCNIVQEEEQDRAVEEKICEVAKIEAAEEEGDKAKPNTTQVKTYNRVMSNHRSVTKPKDVKYKRINKAKSKSLEELRDRLKNWVEHGSKLALEHSQSYA